MKTFNNLKPGKRIKYKIPNGISIVDGKEVIDWKIKVGKIVMAFEEHVVVNNGGIFGNPVVVNEKNYVR
jgi:hypothetical protein